MVSVALVATICAVGPAQAGTFTDSATGCGAKTLTRPFLRWLDPLQYELVSNGGFEAGAANWQLRGGAMVVSGNEPFFVRSAGDSRSLLLPAGSSATSRLICVELLSPTLRFFAKNRGIVGLSSLKVEALVEDGSGRIVAVPVGLATGLSSWQPTLPYLVLLNAVAPLSRDGQIAVAFRFTPIGLGTKWQIDDVYVDPLKIG
jgi:hypothetical protein